MKSTKLDQAMRRLILLEAEIIGGKKYRKKVEKKLKRLLFRIERKR